jgi:hypothetical protein
MNLNLRYQPFGVLVRYCVFLYFSFPKCLKIRNLPSSQVVAIINAQAELSAQTDAG